MEAGIKMGTAPKRISDALDKRILDIQCELAKNKEHVSYAKASEVFADNAVLGSDDITKALERMRKWKL